MNKPLVLLIDDVSQNIQVLTSMLRSEPLDILYATNGAQALALLENVEPDLVLLDIMMPEMDGFQLCERIKQQPRLFDIPIIFLTAKGDPDSIAKGFAVGGVDYVTKPFNSVELLARINTHLKLRRYHQELKLLNTTKDKFFSIIAHDLKSPFQVFLVLPDLLLDNKDTFSKADIIEFALNMKQSGQNLYKLLDNLLHWARLQMNTIQMNFDNCRLNDAVAFNFDLFQFNAEKKSIKLCNAVAIDTFVWADSDMLNTILRNLVANAIKFTDTDGVITIATKALEEDIEISVTDSGVGINPDYLDKLFRIDATTTALGTANEKGTGLGLVLCKELTDKLNGTIHVESTLGKGSTFVVTLPKCSPHKDGTTDQND